MNVIFSLGFWTAIILLIRASQRIQIYQLKAYINIVIVGYLLVVLSTYPYKLNVVFENIHITIGFVVAISQLFIGWKLLHFNPVDKLSKVAFGIQIFGFCLGILTIFEIAKVLFAAQIVSGLGFGVLFAHTIHKSQRK